MTDIGAGAAGLKPLVRAAVVGISGSRTCGVRDHAVLLAGALEQDGVSCTLHWLWRSEESARGSCSEIRSWTTALALELDRDPPDAVLLHYSVFSYSYRGFPVFVRPMLAALRTSRVPLVSVLHELAFPWRLDGLHGKAWALTQRAILVSVMRASTAVVVTTGLRAQWLASQRWLPRRRTVVAPVFSNLPAPSAGARPDGRARVVGLFGYTYKGPTISLILDAMGILRDRGLGVQLRLLGSPGRPSAAADEWLAAAGARGLGDALSFSGTLLPQELSDALASCEVLLCGDTSGPTSRKGTLAASLASGSPVVAIDGRYTWSELRDSEAAWVVAPTSAALADALGALIADDVVRDALGARGRAFAEDAMSVERSGRTVASLLDEIMAGRAVQALPVAPSVQRRRD